MQSHIELARRNWDPHTLLLAMYNGSAILEKGLDILKRLNHDCHMVQQSSILLRDIHLIELKTYLHTKTYKQCLWQPKVETTQMPINWWVHKQNVVHLQWNIYYSYLKRKEILVLATTWMNLANVMTSIRRQSQKTSYCMILLKWNV